MKTLFNTLVYTVLLATGVLAAFGQTASTGSAVTPSSQDKTLTDADLGRRLQADLKYRNSDLRNETVSWFDSGMGYYYGTYNMGGKDYIVRYDNDGRYVETLKKGDWSSSDVPAELKTSFDKSPYKTREVTSYWVVADPDKKGYYLEVQNKQGKTSKIWADEKGKFSAMARKSTPAKPKQ